jgi:5-methyltetrahydropteroyltriglutamate--homocysteine methyltransferase
VFRATGSGPTPPRGVHRADGKRFFRSGDLGRVDEDGYFFMTDRLKRMINASGFKVWPAEVEALMFRHPAIQEACIISTKDAYRGESVKAVVVLRPSHRGQVTEQDIIDWCRDNMAVYKVPRVVQFVEALPKSGSGKVMWRTLQEAHVRTPPSPAACPNPPGWPRPTSSGRSGRPKGDELRQAKADATLLWIKAAGRRGAGHRRRRRAVRQHFVHGFLEQVEGIDFEHKVEDGHPQQPLQRHGAAGGGAAAPEGPRACVRGAAGCAPTPRSKLKFTLPGPMTIVDTVADRFYGDRVKMAFAFAELLNQEALALQADGVDIIQFDEPAFNVYMDEAADWGVQALERAAQGLTCTTAVHICYGYGIQANVDWKKTLGDEWRQYEQVFPALAASSIQQVSLECYPLARAARPDGPAGRQGRDGGRDRRGQRRD